MARATGVEEIMMNDRRRSRRVTPPQEVVGTVKATVPARVLDLSTRGMQVEVASTLRPGVECNVSLPTATGELRMRVRVERCRARTFNTLEAGVGGILYRAGLSFVDLPAETLETLEDVLVDFSLTESNDGKGSAGGGPIRIQIAPEHVNHR
jgi:hypothetical protein